MADVAVSILNKLIDATAEALVQGLQNEVLDISKAGLVRPGKLQDDPTKRKINITIHTGGEDWKHVLNTDENGPGWHGPTYTIGGRGSSFWRRRFFIRVKIFIPQQRRDDPREISLVVQSRIEAILAGIDLANVGEDDFGEHAFGVQVCDSYLRESGGEGMFIWNGEIRYEFLTEKRY